MLVLTEVDLDFCFSGNGCCTFPLPPPLPPLFLFSCTISITLLPGILLPDFLWEPALSHSLVHMVYTEQTPGMSRRLVLLIYKGSNGLVSGS